MFFSALSLGVNNSASTGTKSAFSWELLAVTTRACLKMLMLLALLSTSHTAWAQSCGSVYTVQQGNSISRIARIVYGDTQKWSVIYNVNLDVIGTNPNVIEIGQQLRIPCLDEESGNSATNSTAGSVAQKTAPTPRTLGNTANSISLLTADDYAPFTDRGLINGGLITDLLVSALNRNPDKPDFDINWVNDWSTHLDPLLSSNQYDMGFPWLRPDCQSTPGDYRCQNFRFSYPIFEMLVLLFVDKSRPITFQSDVDIEGAVLCRPKGYYTHDLEKDGRLWLTNNTIVLEQPDSIEDCFKLLTDGLVDAVALNEFTGRSAINSLSLKDRVEALENRPLSVEGLHVVVHNEHPRAAELIEVVNESMSELQLSEAYSGIIEAHFRAYWLGID